MFTECILNVSMEKRTRPGTSLTVCVSMHVSHLNHIHVLNPSHLIDEVQTSMTVTPIVPAQTAVTLRLVAHYYEWGASGKIGLKPYTDGEAS